MAPKSSLSVERSAPRAESKCEAAPKPKRGRLACFALQLDAIINGLDEHGACALARAAALPAAKTLGEKWAKLDDQAPGHRRDLPATRVLLPAGSLPPIA